MPEEFFVGEVHWVENCVLTLPLDLEAVDDLELQFTGCGLDIAVDQLVPRVTCRQSPDQALKLREVGV